MKKLTAVICTAMMALSLTACGGNTKEVSVNPEKLAEEPLKRGEILQIHLKESLPARHICLVQNASRPQSIAAQKLIETLIRI